MLPSGTRVTINFRSLADLGPSLSRLQGTEAVILFPEPSSTGAGGYTLSLGGFGMPLRVFADEVVPVL